MSFMSYQRYWCRAKINNVYSHINSWAHPMKGGGNAVCCSNSQTIESDIFLNMLHILSFPRLILMQIHANRVLN
jgi:hypothetical protein